MVDTLDSSAVIPVNGGRYGGINPNVNRAIATRLNGGGTGGINPNGMYSRGPTAGGLDRLPSYRVEQGAGGAAPGGQMETQGLSTGGWNPQRPTRQTVNDQGWFGGQAANVNQRLSQLLDPSYATVRRTDADISPVFQQIDRQSVQSARMGQAAAAERAAAEGTLQGGGFSNTAQQINEQARAQAGDQQAQVMYDASGRRQSQIDSAMGLAANLAEGQQGRNVQRELADLQNDQFFQDLQLRGQLGFGDLDLRRELGRGDLDLRRELGRGDLDLRGRQVNNQNNQFYDDLGFRRTSFEGQMNQNIINQLLGF